MPVYKADALVLRRRTLGEADRVVVFFTREYGRLDAAARGVRKTTSRQAGRLEPFAHVGLLLAEGRTLDVVAQVEVIAGRPALRRDLARFGMAALVAELLEGATPEHQAHPEIFDLANRTFDVMAGGDPDSAPESAALWFTLHLVSLSGFQPALDRCAVCAGSLGAPSWSHALGGAVCPRCARRDPGASRLRAWILPLLRAAQKADMDALTAVILEPAERYALLDLLRGYAEHRFEIRLRSPAVIARLQ